MSNFYCHPGRAGGPGDFRAQFDTATPPSDHTPLERRCALCVAAVEFAVPSEVALLRFLLALAPAARKERHLVRDFFSSTYSNRRGQPFNVPIKRCTTPTILTPCS